MASLQEIIQAVDDLGVGHTEVEPTDDPNVFSVTLFGEDQPNLPRHLCGAILDWSWVTTLSPHQPRLDSQ